ncbi:AraC family transcriptional regulator [Vibrio sp. MACH09]|uniref:AraC family transcriptional regulator n=1 Tax=unclassified Vibrio TaxID=2614977 RepID=UPI001493303D|nr:MULTISPECIES: AraC family transcriptional regulator [unclassified Vibrio]NOI67498.1 AraC family transcriptional regulator [Vibrio sp. 99-8-1]GLO63820.1 AraC family transcriptional regulator [Vibrio sp. MACH09]
MSRITIYEHNVFIARKRDRYPVTQCGVIFVREGFLTYKNENDEISQLKAGEFTVYHSDQLRDLESFADDGHFLADIITFEPSLFRQFCDTFSNSAVEVSDDKAPVYLLNESHKTALQTLTLLIEAKQSGLSSELTLESLSQALLFEIIHVAPNLQPVMRSACNQSTAQKVIGFIELNIENDVSLDMTAHFLGISIATLKRRLAAENLSFSQILKVKRVNHAATKLRLSSKSIAQIAFESGFKSAAHFSTAFKGVQGMTPKEFRQQITQR